MNGSDALPASIVNKITSSGYITLDSLISSPILAGGASDLFMLPPYISSSSIDSPCDSCSACLLPTVHPAMPYNVLLQKAIEKIKSFWLIVF